MNVRPHTHGRGTPVPNLRAAGRSSRRRSSSTLARRNLRGRHASFWARVDRDSLALGRMAPAFSASSRALSLALHRANWGKSALVGAEPSYRLCFHRLVTGRLFAMNHVPMRSNPPVNTDARGRAAVRARYLARAGYRER